MVQKIAIKLGLSHKDNSNNLCIDYEKMFNPFTNPTTIRAGFGITRYRGWTILQLDVHNAFLQGQLKEGLYDEPSPDHTNSTQPS